MAGELNMEAKHSIERQTAHNVDCFTTVSDVTAKECEELLDKRCDAILMNGFENDFVPVGSSFTAQRKRARQRLLRVANALIGEDSPMIHSFWPLAVGMSSRIKVSTYSLKHCIDSTGNPKSTDP